MNIERKVTYTVEARHRTPEGQPWLRSHAVPGTYSDLQHALLRVFDAAREWGDRVEFRIIEVVSQVETHTPIIVMTGAHKG